LMSCPAFSRSCSSQTVRGQRILFTAS
jgi:hypothetical protein